MKRKIRKILKLVRPLIYTGVLLVAFQNCSGNFQTAAPSATQNSASSTSGGASTLSVVLGWDPSTSANIQGYRIYLGTTATNLSTVIDVGMPTDPTAPQYQVTNLNSQSVYYAVVKAYDASGDESVASNQIEISSQ